MAYIPRVWEDDPSTETPLDEDNMNHIEQGIYHAGDSIELTIDSSTYVMMLKLKDSSGATISSGTIDLPLETMVVGAEYDSETKEIVLTLKSGSTIRFSVADLVDGLVSEDSLAVTLQPYVQNTDYASDSTGGVIKIANNVATNIANDGRLYARTRNYNTYLSDSDSIFISKGTLENVLNAKIGDINTALDSINGENV